MNPKLKILLMCGTYYIVIVSISLLFVSRNSQQTEEVNMEKATRSMQDVTDQVTQREREPLEEITEEQMNRLMSMIDIFMKYQSVEEMDIEPTAPNKQGTLREKGSEEAVKLHEADYCDPRQTRVGEEGACFNYKGVSVPCRTRYKVRAILWKKCTPPYIVPRNGRSLTLFICTKFGWYPRNACYPDCGVSIENNKYPWIVAIYNSDGKLTCTGTIITSFHVLTAATCFDIEYNNKSLLNQDGYTIVAGKHYSDIQRKHKSAEVRKIKHAVVHGAHLDLFKVSDRSVLDLVLFEVDREFTFFGDIRPSCIDWESFYDESDFRDGNEAVAVGWRYDKDEVIPCENQNEFNVQYWEERTCQENLPKNLQEWKKYIPDLHCGTYTGDQTNCGISKGVGLFFKSNPWRYYLKGVTSRFTTVENVTHIFYTRVSGMWLKESILRHPKIFGTYDHTVDKDKPITKTGCRLPEHIKYGRFSMILGRAYRVNTWVPLSTKITLHCADSADDAEIAIQCSRGTWVPRIDKLECKRPGSCPALLSSESEDVTCRLNNQEVNCTDSLNNTMAVVRCKPFYIIPGNKPIYRCHNGEWDQPFARCTPECGIKRVDVTTLTIGGSQSIKNEYPWVVAVFRSMELICGGTIISRKYVLSAAHCFTDSNGSPRSKEMYTIIAGKYYRNISEIEPSTQSRKIKSLHIHSDYKGKLQKHRDDIALIELDMELTLTWEVQPACVDWDNEYEDFDFVDGNKAVVTGWGYTKEAGSPSTVLRKLVIPFRPKDVCVRNLPEDFSEQYMATDKICAGYENNDMNVCTGDSGGGLYFKSGDNRFYVRGIVSLTVRNDVGGCRSNKFALYTKVSKYLSWIESITRRVL